MKKILALTAALLIAASSGHSAVRIYGAYLGEVNVHSDGNRYYQDTMFTTYPPNATFNSCVDVLVLKGWYSFGNDWEYEPVDDHVLDKGRKAQYENMGKCNGVTIKRLDPEAYNMLNEVSGQTAEAGTPAGYIGTANMKRTLLFNNAVLEEGTNYFTFVCPQANELMYSAMIGLYLSDADKWSTSVIPKEGTAPDLCAKEAGAGTQDMEGELVCGAPNPRKDAQYFFPSNVKMDRPTLRTVIGEYKISIPFFYLAGSNSAEVNPDGLTSPSSPGWVAEDKVDPDWALSHTSGNEVAYLALCVSKESTKPKLATPTVLVPPGSYEGYILMENEGAGSFDYTASSKTDWITMQSETASGNVSLQQKIYFNIKKGVLGVGRHVGMVELDLGSYGKKEVKIIAVVEEPASGAIRLKGLYIMSGEGENPYYQDTMISSLVPSYNFDGGCMDILLAEGVYLFGNDALAEYSDHADYLRTYALDRGKKAEYTEAGSFQGSNQVLRLSGDYKLINQALDNGEKPDADSVGDFVKLSSLTKRVLDCYLQPGTNRFTLVFPEASEFESESDMMQLGLFLGEKVASGAIPDLAACNSELYFDAVDMPYATYSNEDRTYHYDIEEGKVFTKSTLKCEKEDCQIELTKFFLLGKNDEYTNPFGMTSPAACGYVATGGDSSTAWPVHASPQTVLGYLEVVVHGEVPEPAFLGLLALLLLLWRRK
ncbi:hypothetical protein IKW72_04460 [bacterium]|nr:hypothetical protein [bacterium]